MIFIAIDGPGNWIIQTGEHRGFLTGREFDSHTNKQMKTWRFWCFYFFDCVDDVSRDKLCMKSRQLSTFSTSAQT